MDNFFQFLNNYIWKNKNCENWKIDFCQLLYIYRFETYWLMFSKLYRNLEGLCHRHGVCYSHCGEIREQVQTGKYFILESWNRWFLHSWSSNRSLLHSWRFRQVIFSFLEVETGNSSFLEVETGNFFFLGSSNEYILSSEDRTGNLSSRPVVTKWNVNTGVRNWLYYLWAVINLNYVSNLFGLQQM